MACSRHGMASSRHGMAYSRRGMASSRHGMAYSRHGLLICDDATCTAVLKSWRPGNSSTALANASTFRPRFSTLAQFTSA
eukprot:6173300-Pleurochrysis_carterae.AAC.1